MAAEVVRGMPPAEIPILLYSIKRPGDRDRDLHLHARLELRQLRGVCH
jgi:hypothetical protein